METMLDLGVTGLLEMPPAGTLTGIARRAMKGVETFALKTPDQLDEARAFVERHGSRSPLDESPTWRMLVAPSKGTFRRQTEVPAGGSFPYGDQPMPRGSPITSPTSASNPRSSSGVAKSSQ